MKARSRPRFNVEALRERAGAKAFERGEIYYRDGRVQVLDIGPQRVLAQIAGTDDYRTEIVGRGAELDGTCSCPAFEDWGFCKHLVALALAANAAGDSPDAEGNGALSRIRRYLQTKDVDTLVKMILEMAERDSALFRRLDIAAAAVQADDAGLEVRLRKAIDGATRTGNFVDYGEAPGWAADVDAALDALADMASGGRARLALKLAERAIDRIEQAIEHIDDSDGHCGRLLSRAGEIHLAAARAARPAPMPLARELFSREMEGAYDTFDGAAATYADVLGEEGLAEYRRLADEAWAKLPPRTGTAREHARPIGSYDQLMRVLDFFAERDGDVDARVALRSKDLSSSWEYLQLAEFCLSQGRKDEALRRAQDGLWIFEDARLDERLVLFVVGIMAKDGRRGEAQAHLWRAFEKAASFELYRWLRKLGGKAARERAVELLEDRSARAGQASVRWGHPAELLTRILVEEKMFDASWVAVRKHGASMDTLQQLARASETTHPREAVEAYARRVEQLVQGGGDPAYKEAVALIARMGALRSAVEQSAYTAEIKARFGRKRNFMKLLGKR